MAGTDSQAVRDTRGLAVLFGIMYFLQGIGEPTEGLIAQPVQSLLKSWELSPQHLAAFAALLELPWSLKPLFGLLSDFVPLGGSRRRGYLVASSLAATLGFLALYCWPPERGEYVWLLLALLVPTCGVAFSDVVIDALMIEHGQPLRMTGRLQSVQWGALWCAAALTGAAGGYLSGQALHQTAFLICGCFAAVMLVLSLTMVHESPHAPPPTSFRMAARTLWSTSASPTVLRVCGFLFLWNFNPFSSTVLYLHMTQGLGYTEAFYGWTKSLLAVASIAACVAYGTYCRRVPMRLLVHASIVLGILSTLAYTALTAWWGTACAVTCFVGFSYMTAMLIQLDLAARVCPLASAATVFALIMAISNLSTSVSTWIGGYGYAWGIEWWGQDAAFRGLVVIGALLTAGCWLVMPSRASLAGPEAAATHEGPLPH